MNKNDLKKMSNTELTKELNALLHEQFNMRIQKGTGQMVRSHLIRKVRRDIARIKTILTNREITGTDI